MVREKVSDWSVLTGNCDGSPRWRQARAKSAPAGGISLFDHYSTTSRPLDKLLQAAIEDEAASPDTGCLERAVRDEFEELGLADTGQACGVGHAHCERTWIR